MLGELKENKEEKKLIEITEFYKEVLDGIVDGVWVTDKEDIIKYANKGMEKIAGIPKDSIIGARVLTDFPESTLKFFRPCYLEAKDLLKPIKYDSIPVVTPSNRESFQSGWLIPVLKEEKFDGMICTVEDITERKLTLEKLKKSEEKLRILNKDLELRVKARTEELKKSEEKYSKLFHTAPYLIALSLLSDGAYYEVNDSFIDFTGYTRGEIIGKTPTEIGLVKNLKYRDEMKELLKKQGYFRYLEVPIRLKNGETKTGLLSGESIYIGKEDYLLSTWMDISDRFEVEKKLKESKDKFYALFNMAGDAIFIHDIEGNFLEVNQTAVERLGYSKKEFLQMTPMEIDTPEYAMMVKKRVEELMEHGRGSFETAHVTKDGQAIPTEISSKVIDYGDKKAILSIARDITERKKNEEELRNRMKKTDILNRIIIAGNEAKNYLSFLDAVLSSTLELMNFEGGGIYIADRKDKMIEMVTEKGLPADFVKRVKKVRYDVSPRDVVMIKGRSIFTENYPEIDPENSKKWGILSLASVPLFSKEEIVGAINIASKSRYTFSKEEKDILQFIGREIGNVISKLQTEEKLTDSERKFRTIAENIPGMVYRGKPDWSTEIITNSEMISGYWVEEFNSQKINWLDLIHPDDKEEVVKQSLKLNEKPIALSLEYRIIAKDGSIHWINDRKISLFSQEGVYIGVDGVVFDITEKKIAQKRINDSEEKLNNLISNISDVLIEINLFGKISFVSTQISNLIGYNPNELEGHNLFDLAHPEDSIILKPLKSPSEILNFEFRIKHKHGYYIPVSIKGTMIMTKGSLEIIGVLSDITDRKKVEAMMKREVKQLKELEQIRTDLINRISHEFNTPLSSIMSGSDLLLQHYNKDFSENLLEIIEIINKGGHRLKEMVDNLIIVYKIESGELKIILKNKNIIPIIEEVIDDIIHQAKRRGVLINVEILLELTINVDEALISKAILNVLTNAIKNTPPKGNIFIKTVKHQNYADIIIEDTGVGFTKKEKMHLFKRFGKIERYGKGMDIDIEGPGLGLYISNEIVKLHKGEIIVKSKGRNKGSKFIIRLLK